MAGNQRALAEDGQMTVLHERRDADNGVMPPVWTAIALPPSRANGVRAHAQAHAELEHSRKGAGRWHADDQTLDDTEPWIGLHNAYQAQYGVGAHQAVGVEHNEEVVQFAPAFAEVADIAGLESEVAVAAP